MSRALLIAFDTFDHGLLRAASLFVPLPQRAEWLREWDGELFHVRRCCLGEAASWGAQREVFSFCLGSFRDALSLRECRETTVRKPLTARSFKRGSAAFCLVMLTLLLATFVAIANLLPGVGAERDPDRFRGNSGLLLIQDAYSPSESIATITPAEFRLWKSHRQRFFDAFSFYRLAQEEASAGAAALGALQVAHASTSLFTVLGLPVRLFDLPANSSPGIPDVIVSADMWKRRFGADTKFAGSLIKVGGGMARIAGVLPYGSWRLPGRFGASPDCWILEADSSLGTMTQTDTLGYVVAHVSSQAGPEGFGDHIPITGYRSVDNADELCGISFAARTQGPWKIYCFAMFLALLALPAITSVSMSESAFSSHRPPFRKRLNRWLFLAVKLALVAGIAWFASLDLAYANVASYSPLAEFMQLSSCFGISLFGLRWAVADQRQRCPICLGRVTHPAQVGIASCTFLGWNGTEMFCMGGHTLLHVPSLPTSWFGTQRWLYLDNSWDFLFVGS